MNRIALLVLVSFVGLLAAPHASGQSPLSVEAQLANVPPALLDSRAQESARIAALGAVARDDVGLFGRPALVERLRKAMIDREQPVGLRLAIFKEVSVLFFSVTHTTTAGKHDAASGHAEHAAAAESFNAEVRTLLDDNDLRLQKAAFGWLAIFRDPEAMKRALEALRGNTAVPLSQLEAVSVLTLVDAAPFYEALHGAYRETSDVDVRQAALRVLGGYAPARNDLMSAALGAEEPLGVRRAALESLFAVDRAGFPTLTAPLLQEQSKSSDQLATLLITLMQVTRSQSPYRQSKLNGFDDDFDRGVRALLKRSPALREVAHRYLLETDPTYR